METAFTVQTIVETPWLTEAPVIFIKLKYLKEENIPQLECSENILKSRCEEYTLDILTKCSFELKHKNNMGWPVN